MARGFFGYVKAAFSARPLGMPIPPNWVALAGLGVAGIVNPGFWVIGLGAELGYLLLVASNKRFQRVMDAIGGKSQEDAQRLERMMRMLPPDELRRYQLVAAKCRDILQQQQSHGTDVSAQSDALSRLVLVYLQLQVTRLNLKRLLAEGEGEDLPARMEGVQKQLKNEGISPELRNSLQGQLEILQHRLAGRQEAAQKLEFVSAELVRIQEQIELVREQSMLTSDPTTLTERIDAISGSLAQTGDWIREQQRIMGRLDDISAEPPPLLDAPKQAQ